MYNPTCEKDEQHEAIKTQDFMGGDVEIIGKLIVLVYGRVWSFLDPVGVYEQ